MWETINKFEPKKRLNYPSDYSFPGAARENHESSVTTSYSRMTGQARVEGLREAFPVASPRNIFKASSPIYYFSDTLHTDFFSKFGLARSSRLLCLVTRLFSVNKSTSQDFQVNWTPVIHRNCPLLRLYYSSCFILIVRHLNIGYQISGRSCRPSCEYHRRASITDILPDKRTCLL